MLASSVSVKVNNLSNSPFTHRVNQAQQERTAVVDVDGSYLYRKYRSLTEAGVQVSLPACPSVPLTGWNPVNEETCQAIAPSIPRVTSGKQIDCCVYIHCDKWPFFCCCVGLVYTYLAGHVGRTGDQGAFRALAHGYTHWSSGRLEEMDVNTNHPEYCHVQCTMTPSMKSIPYHIYLLLGRDGELATICSATCECAAGYVVFCCYTCIPSLPLPFPPIYLLIRHTASTYA